jgi:hypothetical protein
VFVDVGNQQSLHLSESFVTRTKGPLARHSGPFCTLDNLCQTFCHADDCSCSSSIATALLCAGNLPIQRVALIPRMLQLRSQLLLAVVLPCRDVVVNGPAADKNE